tara:strand:- start:53232 stop:54101 length:870 start_codon:yes stop_codon:yes gene_type:complete
MPNKFRPRIRSRHPSHSRLRSRYRLLPLMAFPSVIRLGSTTELNDVKSRGGRRVELNTIDSIKNSSSKLLMKTCFSSDGVKTADWWKINRNNTFTNMNTNEIIQKVELPFPIIAKSHFGSKGRGNTKLDNQIDMDAWLLGKNINGYIFEKFHNYAREYRLHVNSDGCFYTCRKMLKRDTEDDNKWFRNDANCVWFLETNPGFDKPVNWNTVVEHSVKALKAVGLDFGAVDLRIEAANDGNGNKRTNPDFIVVEINSAPSFGDNNEVAPTKVFETYIKELPKMLYKKSLQ